jgi:hypothetical protein
MNLEKRIKAFSHLGELLENYFNKKNSALLTKWRDIIEKTIQDEHIYNAWFTEENVNFALKAWAENLTPEKLNTWLAPYRTLINEKNKTLRIGVIMAGNIPMVGMHDFISVLICGHHFVGKLSSKDDHLPKMIADILCDIEPLFSEQITFSDNFKDQPEAIIATGSNNSARYFDYYFAKFPSIIRKTRNSIAVLNGNETNDDIKNLAEDIFRYFGMGCRNVSKLFVPENYSFNHFFEVIEPWHTLYRHNKYANNYDYHQSVFLMNKIPFLDNGFVIVKNDRQIYSPLSVIFYEYYSDITILAAEIEAKSSEIQCIVSNENKIFSSVQFGRSQKPELWEYADNLNTIDFLLKL